MPPAVLSFYTHKHRPHAGNSREDPVEHDTVILSLKYPESIIHTTQCIQLMLSYLRWEGQQHAVRKNESGRLLPADRPFPSPIAKPGRDGRYGRIHDTLPFAGITGNPRTPRFSPGGKRP